MENFRALEIEVCFGGLQVFGWVSNNSHLSIYPTNTEMELNFPIEINI